MRGHIRSIDLAVRVVRAARHAKRQAAESRAVDSLFSLLRWVSPPSERLGPPKGTFSALILLRGRQVPGELLLERQDVPRIPQDSMRARSGLDQHLHQPWPVFWTRHDHARLIGPTLVLLDESKRACLEAMYGPHRRKDPSYRTVWLPAARTVEGSWTSVVSLWTRSGNYYHWLTDALPRLALMERLPEDTQVLVPGTLREFQRETLGYLGLASRFRQVPEEHILVERFFFSAPTAMTGCTNPYGMAFLRDRFIKHADPSFRGPEKLYVQRRGQSRGLLNENEVSSFMSDRGWTPIDPGQLTFAQQVSLFAGARAICGVHGAALTNIVWCASGCEVVELMADNYLNGCFESISAPLGLRHRYLVFPGDQRSRIRIDLDRLSEVLPL